MTGRSPASDALVEGLPAYGIECFAYVPSSHIAPAIRALQERSIPGFLANRGGGRGGRRRALSRRPAHSEGIPFLLEDPAAMADRFRTFLEGAS